MAKKMLIDATHAEETRVVVVDGNKVEEFDFETVNKRQLAGNIYLAKVTRVEPSLQAAFVDYGGNRHGFLAFSEIHPDYYQIPVADRLALIEEEKALAAAEEAEGSRRRRPGRARAEEARGADAVAEGGEIPGMAVLDPAAEGEAAPADAAPQVTGEAGDESDEPYVAADHASETDRDIESVAEEDVIEEIRQPRKPRPRKYKIQEVIKVRQIMLVQVVKEERGNKGAALTTYLSLAGRYCVLMPNTARGGGISRKITNAADRKKLKEIAAEIDVPEGAGLIIRTAGSQRTKAEIKRDYEYLMRLWEQIRELTLKSIAPAPIYEEGDLIKRSIRDLYNKEIDEVLVEGAEGYRTAKDFMKMIMPSHAKNVKQYTDPLPLFARYQVESYLAGMFNPTVQLKSGGYIVIGVTEALVAIDVNSGRATKKGSIEETALETNLEAAEEIARQLRLRDLAGLIVIDFIDMEERKNNAAVEKRLKEKLKTDRARIQVGRISGFGLLEMSRQRLRPGMLESTTAPCPHCHGTGIIRSDDSLALQILRQLEEEGTRKRSREVLLRAPVAIVNFLMNQKRERIAQIEQRYGLAVRIEADPAMISPDFTIEKFKTATRVIAEAAPVVSVDAIPAEDLDEEVAEEDAERGEETGAAEASGEPARKKKRRRRRRRRGSGGGEGREAEGAREGVAAEPEAASAAESAGEDEAATAEASAGAPAAADDTYSEAEAKPARPRRTRVRSRRKAEAEPGPEAAEAAEATPVAEGDEAPAAAQDAAAEGAEAAAPKRRSRSRKKPGAAADATAAETETGAAEAEAPKPKPRSRKKAAAEAAPDSLPEPAAEAAPAASVADEAPAAPAEPARPMPSPEPAPAAAQVQADPELAVAEASEDKPAKSKRRGWWSLGR
ncbi:Rne/Rng family ribonuclease [Albidovulum sp.]